MSGINVSAGVNHDRAVYAEKAGTFVVNSSVQPPVLIVGAGPTGLVLALWLTRLGIGVRIIDKLGEAGTTSRALAVQARTLEFYRQLGIAEWVVNQGVKVAGINLWAKGRRAARVPLENLGADATPFPFPLVFPQDAHERLLIEQLAGLGVTVERRTDLLRFEQTATGITATLRGPDKVEEKCDAAYLAGCDGARSAVREVLGVGFSGGTYQGLFYVADVEARGPVTDFELHVDLDGSDLLLVFPMKGKGRIRLVGNVRDMGGKKEDELTFADVSSRPIGHLNLKIDSVNWFSTYKVHHRVADRFRDRRVFLLGDAAHVHSPVGGQGMNTGIGDAVNLAWKLAAVLRSDADARLLDSYETERIAFARRLVATTDRAFTFATAGGTLARFVRTRLMPRVAPVLFRLPATRAFLFRTVSQIGVHYPKSVLSEGKAAALRGGDRLPWVGGSAGEDNFAPLGSLAWQVHVYGEAGPGVEEVCARLALPLHVFAWSARMRAAGLARGALYLIRPDGYLGLIEAGGRADGLAKYLDRQGLLVDRA
jgi:2-polyprenyl-6-methoxyphenol hydroxylase-like FAD-dependent oxidoreductase